LQIIRTDGITLTSHERDELVDQAALGAECVDHAIPRGDLRRDGDGRWHVRRRG
jgi:hypothetical protein